MKKAFLLIFSYFAINIMAHPHCWIDSKIVPVLNDEGLSGFNLEWTFDEGTSAGIMEVYDEDQNQQFSKTEIDSIAFYSFSEMLDSNFYLRILSDNKEIKVNDYSDLAVVSDGWSIVYKFFVSCAISIKDFKEIKITQMDDTYFIDFIVIKEENVINNSGIPIKTRIFDDEENSFYFGQVIPTTFEIILEK